MLGGNGNKATNSGVACLERRVLKHWSYRGTSLIRKRTPLGPFRRPVPRLLGGSSGVRFRGTHVLLVAARRSCKSLSESVAAGVVALLALFGLSRPSQVGGAGMWVEGGYRETSLIRNIPLLGPYSMTMLRVVAFLGPCCLCALLHDSREPRHFRTKNSPSNRKAQPPPQQGVSRTSKKESKAAVAFFSWNYEEDCKASPELRRDDFRSPLWLLD